MPHINKLYENTEDELIFSCDNIKFLFHKLQNKNSFRPDGISNILLTKLRAELCKL